VWIGKDRLPSLNVVLPYVIATMGLDPPGQRSKKHIGQAVLRLSHAVDTDPDTTRISYRNHYIGVFLQLEHNLPGLEPLHKLVGKATAYGDLNLYLPPGVGSLGLFSRPTKMPHHYFPTETIPPPAPGRSWEVGKSRCVEG